MFKYYFIVVASSIIIDDKFYLNNHSLKKLPRTSWGPNVMDAGPSCGVQDGPSCGVQDGPSCGVQDGPSSVVVCNMVFQYSAPVVFTAYHR